MVLTHRKRVTATVTAVAMATTFALSTSHAELLEEIKAQGQFTAGTEARFPPFEFVEDGEIVGYSADMMVHVMEELPDVEIIRMDLPWQGILPGLERARFDYVVTSVTATKERAERYHLSPPIADATMAILRRADDDSIQSADDLGGKVVGTQSGSAQLEALEIQAEKLEAEGTPVADINTYTDFDEAYADLGAGRLDAVVNSLPNLLEAERTRPDVFAVAETFGDPMYFTWAGRRDEASESLNAFMDEQIQRLNEDGTLAELQEEWFGGEMDLPMELPEPPE